MFREIIEKITYTAKNNLMNMSLENSRIRPDSFIVIIRPFKLTNLYESFSIKQNFCLRRTTMNEITTVVSIFSSFFSLTG